MRVLTLVKYYYPSRGGMETYVKQICEGLVARGSPCTVLAFNHVTGIDSSWEDINGVKVRRLRCNYKILSQPMGRRLKAELMALAESHDVILLSSPFPNAEVLSSILGRRPLVISWQADPSRTRWSVLYRLYLPFLRRTLEAACRITPSSPLLVENSPTLQPYLQKCEPIPLSFRPHARDEAITERQTRPVRCRLLFVGSLRQYKGVQYLIRALTLVPDATLEIIGQGEEEITLRKLAGELALTSRIEFLTDVSDEELVSYYRTADVFILPSINPAEAFGIVQAEAMSYGLPVINTRLASGVPFVSVDGLTGLTVRPASPGDLAAAINRLLHEDEFYAACSRNALERAERFTERAMVDAYVRVLRDCAGSSA
ncbi:MAG: glycosyltransferase [Gemmatimonadota bacterium]|nr:glycosyltransferase [Gemmatimonadota bacterium]